MMTTSKHTRGVLFPPVFRCVVADCLFSLALFPFLFLHLFVESIGVYYEVDLRLRFEKAKQELPAPIGIDKLFDYRDAKLGK